MLLWINLTPLAIAHAEPRRAEMVSGTATPPRQMLQWRTQMRAAETPANIVSIPEALLFRWLSSETPMSKKERGRSVKKATERYKCMRPAVSGNSPMPLSTSMPRLRRTVPRRLRAPFGRIWLKLWEKMNRRSPPAMRAELKMGAVSPTPRSLRAFLFQLNHGALPMA